MLKTIVTLLFAIIICNVSYSQTYWNQSGNIGTNPELNFLGTTDSKDLVFRTNNLERLRVTISGRILLNGGNSSTYIGMNSGNENSTGIDNVALGHFSLNSNSTGYGNMSIGAFSLRYNTTGRDNTAISTKSLFTNTSGIRNVSIGSHSGFANLTGNDNTSIGTLSLYNNSSGIGNTTIGYYSLKTNVTGSYNTTIGYGSDVISNNLVNATAIGYNAKVSTSNSLVLGATGADLVNVGIGTTSPSSRLEINSNFNGVSGLKFSQLNSSSTASISNGLALSVDPNGNVINTQLPLLDGSETKIASGANINITGNGSISNPYIISNTVTNVWSLNVSGNVTNTNTGSIILGNSISNAPAAYKLIVSDGILTEKIKVTLKSSANWADYVFEDEYYLHDLNALEKFIKINKHLPGVPSSTQLMEQGGIDVAEMLKIQMEKIEELTLYVLELKKKNEELASKVNTLLIDKK